ncbi:hypothetical protein VFPFJ_11746 [Purpureocillium lilacinum]|uniref:Argonaute linker 1 domain-containing protein n=1 Tax=Purpureocillium lilacinum TaxID=33203 RepID=A0A179EWG7_PURLI|nr:hypothetical protein VFPFJ_11746 [Purpureocillium lilacinum]OAQ57516.1 hypothetical protein VFPFJ_11746 [Purpureocillium lilacinum]
MDALNVVFGYGPRSNLDQISAIGSERYFPFGAGKAIANVFHDGRALIASRGFVHSARLGTGRLLLNVNVTHGIFRPSGKVVLDASATIDVLLTSGIMTMSICGGTEADSTI